MDGAASKRGGDKRKRRTDGYVAAWQRRKADGALPAIASARPRALAARLQEVMAIAIAGSRAPRPRLLHPPER